jgi:hypothetical protein
VFWDNRIAATDPPLSVEQTKIPIVPDQTDFLERWFEFHQGYRIVKLEDGTEQRHAVLGEPLKDVDPGLLPRTFAELRARRSNNAQRPANRFRRRRLSSEEAPEGPIQSIEDALDGLLDEAASDNDEAPHSENHQPITPEARQTAAEPALNSEIPELDSSPVSPQTQLRERLRERFARVFGTREDVERDDYVSPIATMYGRAFQRYRQAEEARSSENTRLSVEDAELRETEQDMVQSTIAASRALQSPPGFGDRAPDWFVIRMRRPSYDRDLNRRDVADSASSTFASRYRAAFEEEDNNTAEQLNSQLDEAVAHSRLIRNGYETSWRPCPTENSVELDMDKQDRPPPLEDADMTRTLSCRVCYSQLADVALLPCGHMVLCTWCADTIVPVRHNHLPAIPSKCPVCKKSVKQRYKIHM